MSLQVRVPIQTTVVLILLLVVQVLVPVSSFVIPKDSHSIVRIVPNKNYHYKLSSSFSTTTINSKNQHHHHHSILYNAKKGIDEVEQNKDDTSTTNTKTNTNNDIDNDNDNDNENENNTNKEKVWNTSIFPTKVTMSPPVEKDKAIPQIYIQTLAAIIGILSGVSVSVFKLSIDALRQFAYSGSLVSSGILPIYLIPILGSIAVALLSMTGEFSPGLRGVVQEVDEDSLDSIIDINVDNNNNNNKKVKRKRKRDAFKPIRKSLAAILTLGTGNSLGPEGPGVEIGTAVSRLGMMLWPPDLFEKDKDGMTTNKKDDDNGRISRNRLLLACGAAAGVSSGFNAPLSGVFFALEVVQASLQPVNIPSPPPTEDVTNGSSSTTSDANVSAMNSNMELQQESLTTTQGGITAILISSVLAALVARVFLGNELALMLVTYEIRTPLIELPLYTLLGISCGLMSVVFSQAAKFFKNVFDGAIGPKPVRRAFRRLPASVLPIIGGVTCGIVGIFYPQILFFGYDTLNKLLLDNTLPTTLLLTLLAAKTFTTAVCAGSGLVGGTLAPSLFLGGMVGASFHNIACHSVIFEIAGVPAYSMVGAASTLAAIFRAPLTASLLMFEITRNYDVLLPLLASAGVASLVSDIVESKVEQALSKRQS